jgi:hypothetical protein
MVRCQNSIYPKPPLGSADAPPHRRTCQGKLSLFFALYSRPPFNPLHFFSLRRVLMLRLLGIPSLAGGCIGTHLPPSAVGHPFSPLIFTSALLLTLSPPLLLGRIPEMVELCYSLPPYPPLSSLLLWREVKEPALSFRGKLGAGDMGEMVPLVVETHPIGDSKRVR